MNLSQLDWARIDNGWAVHVPELLEDLQSNYAEDRDWAYQGLRQTIHHQGTIFESSIQTIPFLLAILEKEEVPDKHQLLRLLGDLARVYGSGQEKEMKIRAHNAVRESIDVYLKMLKSSDPRVRENAFRLLSIFGEEAATLVPRLLFSLREELDSATQAEMVYSLGWIPYFAEEAKSEVIRLLEQLLKTNQSNLVGVLSATSLLRILNHSTPSDVIDYSVYVVNHINEYVSENWKYVDIVTEVEIGLAYVDDERRLSALVAMVAYLDEIQVNEEDDFYKYLLCQILLQKVFKNTIDQHLTDHQKLVLTTILNTQLDWEKIVDDRIFASLPGLPKSRVDVQEMVNAQY